MWGPPRPFIPCTSGLNEQVLALFWTPTLTKVVFVLFAFFSNRHVLFWWTFISSFIILLQFLHSWNQVPFLWFLDYSQWSQVPFQHLQCLLISWLCDKRVSLFLELSVGLGYFYGLWTPGQHSPPSDQHFPPHNQKLFSSSASSRALFSELVLSLCSRLCCSRLKVPVSQELTCRLWVSFKKTCNVSFFLATKIEESVHWQESFVKDIFLLIERNDVHEIYQSEISFAFRMTRKAAANEETVFSW